MISLFWMVLMTARNSILFSAMLALALLTGIGQIRADDVTLHEVTDLESLGEQAEEKNLPILLMFSQDNCPYCTILKQNYLLPMLRSGEYHDKVIIRVVRIDGYRSLTDFNGKKIDPEDFPVRYGAYVTPTMVFLDSKGQELAKRLMGVGTEGFFAGDIDDAIDTAVSILRPLAQNQSK